MADSTGAICPIEYRYGRPMTRAIFSREARLRRMLRVEAVLASVQSELGLVPPDAAAAITEAADSDRVRLERVDELDRELKHDVMAVARALAEEAGGGGRWVHFGATSADITDTALALEFRECVAVLRTDLTELARALARLARAHRATAEVGRTHGQHAVPLSFGYKMAVGAAEVLRHRARLDELAPRLCVGKMSGAVGTGAGFGLSAETIEANVMRRLGLGVEEAPTQLVGRDRVAEFESFLALVGGTLERLSTEVRNLQRTEIAEVQEPFDEARQVGSSTMAQKRNPMVSENVGSIARLLRAFAWPALENMALWHERDLTNSANERIVIPHSVILADDALAKLTAVFDALEVDAARMEVNLAMTGGLVMTEQIMLTLTFRGLARNEAHELLRALTRPADGEGTLLDRARRDPTVQRWLRPEEIEELFDPAAYVRAATAKTDRLLSKLEGSLDR